MSEENKEFCNPAVISRFNSTKEKRESFYQELKKLLAKYNAELELEECGAPYMRDQKIIVTFGYDNSFFESEGTGIIPDLDLGGYLNGL